MATPDIYDLEKVHDEQISPLVDQIYAICHEHKIPMVISFAYSQDAEDVAGLCSSGLTWPGRSPRAITEAIDALEHRRTGLMAITIVQGPT